MASDVREDRDSFLVVLRTAIVSANQRLQMKHFPIREAFLRRSDYQIRNSGCHGASRLFAVMLVGGLYVMWTASCRGASHPDLAQNKPLATVSLATMWIIQVHLKISVSGSEIPMCLNSSMARNLMKLFGCVDHRLRLAPVKPVLVSSRNGVAAHRLAFFFLEPSQHRR